MENAALKQEADLLMRKTCLSELLAPYADWFVGGSYSYDLMCWRDLDIYVLDPAHDLRRCFAVGCELTQHLAAKKARFSNYLGNAEGMPNGLYWGIKLGDIRRGAWKLDVWFLDQAGYEEHAAYSSAMRNRLTAENRSIILEIKEAYWQHPFYRDTVTSDLIYRAVFDGGIRRLGDFEGYLTEASTRS
jgi:hypothetical protein